MSDIDPGIIAPSSPEGNTEKPKKAKAPWIIAGAIVIAVLAYSMGQADPGASEAAATERGTTSTVTDEAPVNTESQQACVDTSKSVRASEITQASLNRAVTLFTDYDLLGAANQYEIAGDQLLLTAGYVEGDNALIGYLSAAGTAYHAVADDLREFDLKSSQTNMKEGTRNVERATARLESGDIVPCGV